MTNRKVTAILVGGPADGRRVVLAPYQQHLNVAQRTIAAPYSRHPCVAQTVAASVAAVQYEIFFGEGDTVVMCPHGMDHREAMGRLLQGYQQEVWT